ncbi:MAG: hypothetical protein LBO20_07855 [Bifidobacteriaceae bacterium]|jgi:hypothetical protein|nr:hypothetical protein [Bifidobacteriaceae bacterium]
MSGSEYGKLQWLEDLTAACLAVVRPDRSAPPLLPVDEVGFMGTPGRGPDGAASKAPAAEPEVYLFGMEGGYVIGPRTWRAGVGKERLDQASKTLKAHMVKLRDLYAARDQTPPTVVYSALRIAGVKAVTDLSYLPFPEAGLQPAMTQADAAFNRWIDEVASVRSVYQHVRDM